MLKYKTNSAKVALWILILATLNPSVVLPINRGSTLQPDTTTSEFKDSRSE
jgi:hypothetical protein